MVIDGILRIDAVGLDHMPATVATRGHVVAWGAEEHTWPVLLNHLGLDHVHACPSPCASV